MERLLSNAPDSLISRGKTVAFFPNLTPPKLFFKFLLKILDKRVLKSYIQINTDSIPGGESPPAANPLSA